jgi:predicted kinase
MIRVRSDVERKRLFGYAPEARTQSATDAGLYDRAAGEQTYRRLEELAAAIVEAGYTALIDATFLTATQRAPFRALAARLGVPFVILEFQTAEALLRERITAREHAGGDASEATIAVLERQLQKREALTADERAAAITIDTGLPVDGVALAAAIRRRIAGDGASTN